MNLKMNTFAKASFYSAISSFIKILTTFILGKIIALKLGAEGMALFGQVLNFITIVLMLSGGTITQGIVKYIAEYKHLNNDKLESLLSTSLKIILYSCGFISIILLLFSGEISLEVFQTKNYKIIVKLIGVSILFFGLNNFFQSLINGNKHFKEFNIINIISNIFNLIASLILIYTYGIEGVLVSVIVNQILIFIITLFFLREKKYIDMNILKVKFNGNIFKKLMGFYILSLVSSILSPIIYIGIRMFIMKNISVEASGLFEFVLRLSNAGLLFFSLSISTYYIPRIAELTTRNEINKEVYNTYKITLPIIFIILSSVYFCKEIVIQILASKEFLKVTPLLKYQLLGDFFKICAQIISFAFLARNKIRIAILMEIVYNIFFYLLVILLLKKIGLIGASIAYCISYFFYFVIYSILFKKSFKL